MEDVKDTIAKVSRVFGCLRNLIIKNPIFFIPNKEIVYKATVLAVLLHGAEMWALRLNM